MRKAGGIPTYRVSQCYNSNFYVYSLCISISKLPLPITLICFYHVPLNQNRSKSVEVFRIERGRQDPSESIHPNLVNSERMTKIDPGASEASAEVQQHYFCFSFVFFLFVVIFFLLLLSNLQFINISK